MNIRTVQGLGGLIAGLAVVAAFAALLTKAMDTTSYNTWGALIWGPIIVGVNIWLISLAMRSEPDKWIRRVVYIGYAAKLVGIAGRYFTIFVLYGGGGDATRYNLYAARWYFEWRRGVFEVDNPGKFGTHNTELITTAIYTLFGPSPIVGFIVFGTMAFWGCILLVKAFKEAVPRGDLRRYAVLIMFLPTMLFWPSSIGKEAFLMLAVGLTALGAARFFTNRVAEGLVILALGLGGTALIRPHLTVLLLTALFIAQLLRPGSGSPTSVLWKTLGLAVVAGAAVLAITQAADVLGIDDLTVEGVTGQIEWASEQTEGGGSVFTPVPLTHPLGVPAAIVTLLFRPFPWEAGNALVALQALEGVALIVLVLLGWRRLGQVHRLLRSNPWIAFAAVYTLAFILAFSGFSNFGIVARQRSLMIPFFLAFLALPDPRARRPVETQHEVKEPAYA